MSLRAVVFDLDGTLGDTLPLCTESFRRVAQEYTGVRLSDEDVVCHYGLSESGVIARLTGLDVTDPKLPLARFVEIYQELHPSWAPAPFEGSRELLDALCDAGLRIALITGKEDHSAISTLAFFGLKHYFDYCGYGDPHINCKHLRLLELMELWDMRPDELIYVGDAPSDIDCCRLAGVAIISAAWSPTCQGEAGECIAKNPDYRISDIKQLLPLLQSL